MKDYLILPGFFTEFRKGQKAPGLHLNRVVRDILRECGYPCPTCDEACSEPNICDLLTECSGGGGNGIFSASNQDAVAAITAFQLAENGLEIQAAGENFSVREVSFGLLEASNATSAAGLLFREGLSGSVLPGSSSVFINNVETIPSGGTAIYHTSIVPDESAVVTLDADGRSIFGGSKVGDVLIATRDVADGTAVTGSVLQYNLSGLITEVTPYGLPSTQPSAGQVIVATSATQTTWSSAGAVTTFSDSYTQLDSSTLINPLVDSFTFVAGSATVFGNKAIGNFSGSITLDAGGTYPGTLPISFSLDNSGPGPNGTAPQFNVTILVNGSRVSVLPTGDSDTVIFSIPVAASSDTITFTGMTHVNI